MTTVVIGSSRIGVGGVPVAMRRRLPRITVEGTELKRLGVTFRAWGFQQLSYQFIEDFYASTGSYYRGVMADTIEGDSNQGGNLVRLRLELWSFISGDSLANLSVNTRAINNLIFALDAARENGTYILLNGCNVVRPLTVPEWYDKLHYLDRWDVQRFFWSAIAAAVVASGNSTTLLGYDLINEPYISTDINADWYGDSYLGSTDHFTAVIARGPGVDSTTAQAWIVHLRDAIKAEDPDALVTIGLLPFPNGPFGVSNTQGLLDFLSPHLYPPSVIFGQTLTLAQSIAVANSFAAATIPNVVGEILPWGEIPDNDAFFAALTGTMAGLISFSFGFGPNVPPDLAPYPCPNPQSGALNQYFLAQFATYRDAFLAG